MGIFTQAGDMDKWKDLYGGTILSSLALASAKIGNMTVAK